MDGFFNAQQRSASSSDCADNYSNLSEEKKSCRSTPGMAVDTFASTGTDSANTGLGLLHTDFGSMLTPYHAPSEQSPRSLPPSTPPSHKRVDIPVVLTDFGLAERWQRTRAALGVHSHVA